jgi:uracil-DNA glycosylase family 4
LTLISPKTKRNLRGENVILSKKELLDSIAAKIMVCHKCELWKTRKNAVAGEGNPYSQIMLIGEAPGYWEDIKGEPFVGAAGKFLDTLLSEASLSRENIFIGNVLKCKPPKNREPLPSEIETCTPYLDKQIQVIQPKFIVTLGNHSTAYIFSKGALQFYGITRVHGKFQEASFLGVQVTIFPTFHPAAALYSGRYKELLLQDFQLLKHRLIDQRFNM